MKPLALFLFILIVGVLAACTDVPVRPDAPAENYEVQNGDGDVKATISWDGSDWTCTTNPVIEGTPCAQKIGSQIMFFHGLNKIAVEELQNGYQTGQLEIELGWHLTE